MGKKNVSGIVSGAGLVAAVWTLIDKKVRERGGSDEDIHRLGTPDGEVMIGHLADELVASGKPDTSAAPPSTYTVTVDYGLTLEQMISPRVGTTRGTTTSTRSTSRSRASERWMWNSTSSTSAMTRAPTRCSRNWTAETSVQPPCRNSSHSGPRTPTCRRSSRSSPSAPFGGTGTVAGTWPVSTTGSAGATSTCAGAGTLGSRAAGSWLSASSGAWDFGNLASVRFPGLWPISPARA